MLFRSLFSGEGPADLGLCAGGAETCEGADYEYGPMTVIADQVLESEHDYSFLEYKQCGFVSKRTLKQEAKGQKVVKTLNIEDIETLCFEEFVKRFKKVVWDSANS